MKKTLLPSDDWRTATCKHCNVIFQKTDKRQKNCSNKCSQDAGRRLSIARKRKIKGLPESTPETKNCLYCNCEFLRPSDYIQFKYFELRKWCSQKCASEASLARSQERRSESRRNKPLNSVVEKMLESGFAKYIPHDNRYAVTKDGRIFSQAVWGSTNKIDVSWREISRFRRKRDALHLSVPLGWGNVWFVHRLVLLAFIGPSDLQVRHLDGNPTNNNLSNLLYGTAKENAEDREFHRVNKGEVRV